MSKAIDTLLYIIQNGPFDNDVSRIAFINATFHPELSLVKGRDLVLQQHFKPYEIELVEAGFSVLADIPDNDQSYDLVCILLPKNMVEARFMIAVGARILRSGAVLICAADNKAGGSRIKKMMQNFGFQDLQDDARNKARVVWGTAQDLNEDEIHKSYKAGLEQEILNGRFVSRAGVYGWNKIDKGSEILADHIPHDLEGRGADFGCGYGYLSSFLLSNCRKVKQLFCLDADHRALELCRKNLVQFECKKEFLWCDLTKPQEALRNLDFIVMNPPFHQGKEADFSIGQNFIEIAYRSLRRGGRLWMVANKHLPYEEVIEGIFSDYQKIYEGQGFKVFCAVK